jgi:hypothetical protein
LKELIAWLKANVATATQGTAGHGSGSHVSGVYFQSITGTKFQYRAMAAEHHRLAGLCRSPESREQHLRLEKELRVIAANEEGLHGVRAPHCASYPPIIK